METPPKLTDDIAAVAGVELPWPRLAGKRILVTGATGLIGSLVVDVLMHRKREFGDSIQVCALSRDEARAKARFATYVGQPGFELMARDVSLPLDGLPTADYIVHGASNADPLAFSTDPVGTMKANFLGTLNLLEFARNCLGCRLLFLSSGEVYGEGRPDIDSFDEGYNGYVDFGSPRACYPQSKRAAETLCASFARQFQVDSVVARLCYIYGPTMTPKDSKVVAQFIRNVLAGQDIVMKSEGKQLRSYCYVFDAVCALFFILLLGQSGQAYNVANRSSNITIRGLAQALCELSGRALRFEIPDQVEQSGYSPVTRAVLNAAKLEQLGWTGRFDLMNGLARTLVMMRAGG